MNQQVVRMLDKVVDRNEERWDREDIVLHLLQVLWLTLDLYL